MSVYYSDDQVTLYHGDCLDVLGTLDANSIDAAVTDPPYGLEFMGKDWDAPWKYGFSETGYSDSKRMARPNFGSTRNPMCRSCRKHQRGRDRCVCEQPDYDERPADSNVAFQQWCHRWAVEVLRVLKPGGHLIAFGGTRTWHRLACAIEDAGFEIRDSIAWLYGSGFPKSMDVSKAIDKAAGAERTEKLRPKAGHENFVGRDNMKSLRESGALSQKGGFSRPWMSDPDAVERAHWDYAPATDAAKQWQGWGTALKPAHEPIVVARKPLQGTVAANVREYGTGALNIDACRIEAHDSQLAAKYASVQNTGPRKNAIYGSDARDRSGSAPHEAGRWPTNVVLDDATAAELDKQSGYSQSRRAERTSTPRSIYGGGKGLPSHSGVYGHDDAGGASRFFPTFRYEAKADASERPTVNGIAHPTVKPLELMRWLIRLVTPPNGVVLDPFAGSGTTAEACIHEHKRCITIERETDYLPLIVARLTKPMEIGFDFGEGA